MNKAKKKIKKTEVIKNFAFFFSQLLKLPQFKRNIKIIKWEYGNKGNSKNISRIWNIKPVVTMSGLIQEEVERRLALSL